MDQHDSADEYSPTEVATILHLSPSTLRYYAVRFNQFLSTGAQAGVTGEKHGFRHRRYTTADVNLLRRVKQLLDAGGTTRSVVTELGGEAVPRPHRRRRRPSAQKDRRGLATADLRAAPVSEPEADVPEASQSDVAESADGETQSAVRSSEVFEAMLGELIERSTRLEERLDSLEWRLREVRDQLRALRELPQPTSRPNWLRRILGG